MRRLWDSWEDDAEIRDASTNRFVDRERLHHIDYEGRWLSVKGPSITPRPPQGQPIVAVTIRGEASLQLAAEQADVAFVRAGLGLLDTTRRLGDAVAAAGREPEQVAACWPTSRSSCPTTPVPRPNGRRSWTRWRRVTMARTSPTRRSRAPRPQLADRLIEQAGDGVHGFRLHPAVIADDLPPIARRLTEELRKRGVRHPDKCPDVAAGPAGPAPSCQPLRREPSMTQPRQIHLAAHFPGVNNTTVWSDPAAGSHIDFSSFEQLARTAERAKFDFFFLAEGLRMREHAGRLHELDVAGRPDSLAILASLAAVTERIGLMATITTTYHEPYELARQLGTLDHLSDGRAGWNLVTSSDPFTGANFRRGGYLPYDRRYERGEQFVESVQLLWDAWAENGSRFAYDGSQVQIAGEFPLPPLPQGRPAMIQAGDSDAGREFAAAPRRRDLQPPRQARGGSAVLRRRQGPPRALRPRAARARDPPRDDVHPRRHRRRGARDRRRGPARAGLRPPRDHVPRAAVEPRPVGL